MKKCNGIVSYTPLIDGSYEVSNFSVLTTEHSVISFPEIIRGTYSSIRDVIDKCNLIAKNNGYQIRCMTDHRTWLYNIYFVDSTTGSVDRFLYSQEVLII